MTGAAGVAVMDRRTRWRTCWGRRLWGRGISLVELPVVIAIMAVVMSMVVVTLSKVMRVVDAWE